MEQRANISYGLPDASSSWNFDKDFSAQPGELRKAQPWVDEEYEKHIKGVRDRYPLLTSLLLRGNAAQNANLSSIQDTNKYARLADAYNASMRYTATGGVTGADLEGNRSADTGFERVTPLETQDQKQMEQLRQAQGDLRKHQLGEESHFQQDVWKRKGNEMENIAKREYQLQYFQKDEQMRRVMAQFDSWAKMNEAEFGAVLKSLGIPEMQRAKAEELLKKGDYIGYAHFMAANGYTPMAIDQIYTYTMSADVVKQMMDGDITAQGAARALAKIPAQYVINSIFQMLETAKTSGYEAAEIAANTAETAIKGLSETAQYGAEHIPQILGILGTGAVLTGLAPILGAIINKIPVK
jgi:hypothetical protein